MAEKEIASATIKITPEIDWSECLKIVPTEQLVAEVERRKMEMSEVRTTTETC